MTDPKNYVPGSFGCHEALHLAFVLHSAVVRELEEHPAIVAKPKWRALASAAADTLYDLYQAIGEEHLTAAEPPRHLGFEE